MGTIDVIEWIGWYVAAEKVPILTDQMVDEVNTLELSIGII